MAGALAAAAPAVDTNQAFLWNGVHWQQITTEGKAGYIFGIGNLADYEVAASKDRKQVCVSRAFVDVMKTKTPLEIIQQVDKYYQDNPGKLDTLVIEVILGQLIKPAAAAAQPGSGQEMRRAAIGIMVAAFLVGGCSGMSNTQQRTLSGGAIGASSGALIGWAAGCPACGAAIGGGAGLLGGYAYDQYEKSQGRP